MSINDVKAYFENIYFPDWIINAIQFFTSNSEIFLKTRDVWRKRDAIIYDVKSYSENIVNKKKLFNSLFY